MIRIGKPRIEIRDNEHFLLCSIEDGFRNKKYDIWYSVSSEYGKYLCEDRADAFLSIAFCVAIKTGQDISIDAPVSARFLHSLNNTMQPIFCKLYNVEKTIKITAVQTPVDILHGKAVGCGCSLGADSLASLYRHMGPETELGYKVTHLALFNSCQFGNQDQSETTRAFRKGIKKIEPFAKEVGLPIVAINTNLNEFFKESGLTNTHRFINSTLSCPLALQKLFGKYIFASSYSIEQFEFSLIDQSHCESAYVPLFSTESMEIVLANPMMKRIDKTIYISRNKLTTKYLDVCLADQMAFSGRHIDKWLKTKKKLNCGWCDKCLRTLLTLEIIGKIDDYAEIFELEQYYKHRNEYIEKVVILRDNNLFFQEIYDLMKIYNFKIPNTVLAKAKLVNLKNQTKRLLTKLF